jgi:hypothetical protein
MWDNCQQQTVDEDTELLRIVPVNSLHNLMLLDYFTTTTTTATATATATTTRSYSPPLVTIIHSSDDSAHCLISCTIGQLDDLVTT